MLGDTEETLYRFQLMHYGSSPIKLDNNPKSSSSLDIITFW